MLDILAKLLHPDFILALLVLGWLWYLAITKQLPSKQAVLDFTHSLDSKGGNLLVLSVLAVLFTWMGFKFLLYEVDLQVQGKLTSDNATMAQGFQWITQSLSVATLVVLFKAMTGDDSARRRTDTPPAPEAPTTPAVPPPPAQGPA